jgi:hypothetical protein
MVIMSSRVGNKYVVVPAVYEICAMDDPARAF